MINSDNLCMSCMKEIGNVKQCPNCGYHSDTVQIEPYLPVRTVLGNRYLVGKLIDYNGDGATYMGFDLSSRVAVNIREFFPEGIAKRDEVSLSVYCNEMDSSVYNECLQSFIEMWRKLMRLSGLSALVRVCDILEGNGTCYAITENIEGITLREYLLRNNTGYISWEKARSLLMPVLSTLGTLHSTGIVHRGISPSTLVVATDGKIRITGFSVSQVRSARSELKSQLFPGYSAFEQYGYDGRQGTWTDVYGFGAVLYRTLIGTDPIDATERVTNDRLMVPGKFAELLPAYVINGLVNALQILPEDRTRTVEELRAELSASPSAMAGADIEFRTSLKESHKYQTAQRIVDEEDEEDDDDLTYDKREAAKKRHNRSTAVITVSAVIIVLAVIVLVCSQFGFFDNIMNKINNEKNTSVVSEMIEVPNFVGKSYEDEIAGNAYFTKNFKFEVSEIYSSTVEDGYVIRQSIVVDEKVPVGQTITLTVSKGKEMVVFPSEGINGVSFSTVSENLSKLGFIVNKKVKINTNNYNPDTVAGTDLEGGQSYEKGTAVSVYVWGEPETTTTTTATTTNFFQNLFPNDDNPSSSSDENIAEEN